jgi:predicted Zn-dependent protease
MAMNNILMQSLLQQNPDLSFAMEESFPMQSSYAGASPLGPVFELRSGDSMTADVAGQVVNYWQNQAQNLQAAGETSSAVLQAYAHDAVAQGNLLANNNYAAEAGQAYQTAIDICPGSVEPVMRLANLLVQQGQLDQAGQVLDTFIANSPQPNQTVIDFRQTVQAAQGHH